MTGGLGAMRYRVVGFMKGFVNMRRGMAIILKHPSKKIILLIKLLLVGDVMGPSN